MSARENGGQSSSTEADIQEAFRRGYNFEERLHHARKQAGSLNGSISWAEVTENDVLGGKGRHVMDHPGNIFFRKRCEFYSKDYFQTPISRLDQRAIRHKVVDEVLSTGGRFLEPCPTGWKNMIVDNKKLREKIRRRMKDSNHSPPTAAYIEGDVDPTYAMNNLDRNRHFDQYMVFLDSFGVNEANVFTDLNDDDSDNDHLSTDADIVFDMSPTSAMVYLDRKRHFDQDKLALDTSAANEANWDDERLQTVANTEGDICPTSAMDNQNRNRYLDQDDLSLDSSDAYDAIDYFELDDADSDDDHPSTVADIVVDVSPTYAMVNLERNRHLDQDKLFLDTSDANEANVDFEFDEADLSKLMSF